MKFKDKKNEPTIVGSSRKGGQIAQDKEFIDWWRERLKEGKEIGYDCSW